MPEKQTKKSVLKTFLVSYDVFAIFTSVEHMEIPREVKNKSLMMFTLQMFELLMLYLCFKLCNIMNF